MTNNTAAAADWTAYLVTVRVSPRKTQMWTRFAPSLEAAWASAREVAFRDRLDVEAVVPCDDPRKAGI